MSKLLLISNLLLGEKTVRPAEGGTPNSFGKIGGNQWDALRVSHLLASKKPFSSFVVPLRGFEPLTLSGQRPKRCAYANSATGANCLFFLLLQWLLNRG